MIENLLLTIIGAIIVWAIQSVTSHYIKKSRLRSGLLADIRIHIAGAREQNRAVKSLVEETVRQGAKIPFPIFYNIGHYSFYDSIQKELASYLSKAELVKVIKFYQAVWELDVSINALANTLSTRERDQQELTEGNMLHLKKRKARIDSLYEAISSNEVRTIACLPDDYRQVKGADTVLEPT